MKTKVYIPLLTLAACMAPATSMSFVTYPVPNYTIHLKPVPHLPDEFPTEPDPEPVGRRTPPAGISCTISQEEGVTIHSQAVSPIISYEIWDAEGTESIAVLADGRSFTDILYTMEGEYQLRFTTCDGILAGSIFLEND